ncbi:VWA domain-containing protein [Parasedimentitalea psychrophila]|uniref:VWA domain-containing protein n=2 Tax=Parasedimentitalea psychrophila TaxID=2997337 RepID=A0A9Y2L0K7_9RHOB|nr:VWA domain-containing protein [Parasedimentitalea psychrophila]WIY26555.1 VWA domain-containing protein [Parasedimentitalea psychrophila]
MSDPFDDFDDFDDLKTAMRAATPTPDATRKADNIALAEKNFAARQEKAAQPRFTSDHPQKGLFRGVVSMFKAISTRQALTASTALVAVGLFAYLPSLQQGPDGLTAPNPEAAVVESLAGSLDGDGRTRLQATGEAEELSVAPMEAPVIAEQADMAAPVDTLAGLSSSTSVMARPSATAKMEARSLPSPPPGYVDDTQLRIEADTEAYPDAEPNPLKITTDEPVSTFSIDVDTASYAILRSSLNTGRLPSPEQVRIEEMVNYFPYDYAAPLEEVPFSTRATVIATPWNPDTQLVHIALQGEKPALDTRPPLNLVFLIDTSGSMDAPNKLPLLKQSFQLMLAQLRPEDKVAIVAYAGSAGQVLDPTPASDRATILAALDRLDAGGATAGQAGLQQAYATAEAMSEDGDVSRIILATDGDFNVGIHDPDALKDFIAKKRETGTYLSVLGFGRGNLDDATMQALAQTGNGQAAYIDTLSEAQKTLVDQLSGALFPIANDVKIQVEFNPAQIAEYRLIGYETRALNREDFNNDRVDAGEIGAGHSVTAIYEITPVGSPARLSDPLRYQAAEETATSAEYGFLRLRYKRPGEHTSNLIETPILPGGEATPDMVFASAIAGFGQLLQNSPYLGNWSYAQAIDLANGAKGDDAFGYRAQAVQLMRLAQSLSQ